ncbi:DUF6941 family protein [Candidatus Mycobacterium methanotrophicum]|uniref:Uncharacterized protein n=1 Tax=Candidatus Mycobacterium methanotrophicum TaxID=2943498 RepID=A0ABY4QHC2_9MYCO|nr:hypothetical protein [Candidatus Mycobacterium methanotrophicum]UQX10259.1 hypothetical protein M5I08_19155 [Candidatus Mycobacterium methanotrophicum]
MLADAATVADGKLFVHGGCWNTIITPQIPAVHPTLALALVFKINWHEANEDLPVALALVTEDGQPAGFRIELKLRVAPTVFTKKGTDLYQASAHTIQGLTFNAYGSYSFQVSSGDQILASVPLTVGPPGAFSA